MKALFIIITIVFSFSLQAKKSTHAKKYVPKKIDNSQLQKDIKFGDHRVSGQFIFSQEAISSVENEKSLSDLLGLRIDFKDRLFDLSERN